MAVVQDLEQDVEHVGVGLLDLVKEDDAVGLAPDLLGELAGLVVAHIARGRADDPGDRELLHELGHIQPDEGLGGVEHILGQPFDQLGLAHAGGAHEDEGHGLPLGGDAHPAPSDGGGHFLHGLVLADDVLLEPVLQVGQPLVLLLLDLGGRDLGPQLDDPGQVGHGQGRGRLGLQGLELVLEPGLLALELGQLLEVLALLVLGEELGPLGRELFQLGVQPGLLPLIVLEPGLLTGVHRQGGVLAGQGGELLADLGLAGLDGLQVALLLHIPAAVFGHEGLPLGRELLQLPLDLLFPGQGFVVEVHVGAGLVNEVDGLVG